ncbi:MAG: hypothetical protein ACKOTZ_01530, partial [Chloroflexota bacterium]
AQPKAEFRAAAAYQAPAAVRLPAGSWLLAEPFTLRGRYRVVRESETAPPLLVRAVGEAADFGVYLHQPRIQTHAGSVTIDAGTEIVVAVEHPGIVALAGPTPGQLVLLERLPDAG